MRVVHIYHIVCKIRVHFKNTCGHGCPDSSKDKKEGCNELHNEGFDAVKLRGLTDASPGNFHHDLLVTKYLQALELASNSGFAFFVHLQTMLLLAIYNHQVYMEYLLRSTGHIYRREGISICSISLKRLMKERACRFWCRQQAGHMEIK